MTVEKIGETAIAAYGRGIDGTLSGGARRVISACGVARPVTRAVSVGSCPLCRSAWPGPALERRESCALFHELRRHRRCAACAMRMRILTSRLIGNHATQQASF